MGENSIKINDEIAEMMCAMWYVWYIDKEDGGLLAKGKKRKNEKPALKDTTHLKWVENDGRQQTHRQSTFTSVVITYSSSCSL